LEIRRGGNSRSAGLSSVYCTQIRRHFTGKNIGSWSTRFFGGMDKSVERRSRALNGTCCLPQMKSQIIHSWAVYRIFHPILTSPNAHPQEKRPPSTTLMSAAATCLRHRFPQLHYFELSNTWKDSVFNRKDNIKAWMYVSIIYVEQLLKRKILFKRSSTRQQVVIFELSCVCRSKIIQ